MRLDGTRRRSCHLARSNLSPAAKVFHYGQEIFEGLKAYAWHEDQVALFRPEQNARRFNQSAEKMVMPEVPEELHSQAWNCWSISCVSGCLGRKAALVLASGLDGH